MTVTNETGQMLLIGDRITRTFGRGRHQVEALHEVDVAVSRGECLAIIGGSGSGKSTLGRILLGLDAPSDGHVTFDGQPVEGRRSAGYQALRRYSGLVFQNPFSSLDPRWTVARSVAEPLHDAGGKARGSAADHETFGEMSTSPSEWREEQVHRALTMVGLDPQEFMNRYPSDMSGGQAQRVAIARAVVNQPRLLVADEPMSAIDVAARVQILDAFAAIRAERPQMAMIMISHDLGVVQHIADRIMVLHDGRVEEQGNARQVLEQPRSQYTRALIAAVS